MNTILVTQTNVHKNLQFGKLNRLPVIKILERVISLGPS